MSQFVDVYIERVESRLRRRGGMAADQALDALKRLSWDELLILARQEAGR